jgi:hypothetical protein
VAYPQTTTPNSISQPILLISEASSSPVIDSIYSDSSGGIDLMPAAGGGLTISSTGITDIGGSLTAGSGNYLYLRSGASSSYELIVGNQGSTRNDFIVTNSGDWQNNNGNVIPSFVNGFIQQASGTKVVLAPSIPGAGATLMTGPATSTSGDCVMFTGPMATLADSGAACGPPSGTITLTAATSDSASISGVTASSHCVFSPTNLTATGAAILPYISAVSAGSVTITHAATVGNGATYNIVCTVN